MHVGLIGGIGPAATDYYYRGLIRASQNLPDGLDVTIAHADPATLLENLQHGRAAEQASIFERLAHRLHAAGAEAVVVPSSSGHFCDREFAAVSPLPVISLLVSVAEHLEREGYRSVGLLGTRPVMTSGMYGTLKTPTILVPEGEDLDRVHEAYVNMAVPGIVTDEQRDVFFRCGHDMWKHRGADVVLLCGTDLFLAFDGQECGFPVVDCAAVHLATIVAYAG